MSKSIHLSGLNGLRAIAALAVVISHITLALDSFGLVATIFGSDINGNPKGLLLASYGVSIFFALSGFLITFLLLKEKEVSKGLNIEHFYIRRLLRIWPLYYLYFGICIVIYYIYEIDYNHQAVPFYIFLAANIPIIIGKTLPLLTHYWSIGVEEQFYLFWPWIAKVRNSKLMRISILLVFALITLKIIFWIINYKYNYSIPLVALSVTRFQTMIIGCVGAILYYNQSSFIKYFIDKRTQFFCWIILLLTAINKFHISSLIDNEIIAIITVLIIFAQIMRTNYIFNLDNKILDFIGKISYGIYIIHPLIIFLAQKKFGKFQESTLLNYLFLYSLIIGFTILVSYISYNFFEKRFIILKRKFAKIKSYA